MNVEKRGPNSKHAQQIALLCRTWLDKLGCAMWLVFLCFGFAASCSRAKRSAHLPRARFFIRAFLVCELYSSLCGGLCAPRVAVGVWCVLRFVCAVLRCVCVRCGGLCAPCIATRARKSRKERLVANRFAFFPNNMCSLNFVVRLCAHRLPEISCSLMF